MTCWMLILGWTAAAQSLSDQGYVQTPMNADTYQPPIGPGALNAADLPQVTEHTIARADLRYGHNFLMWENNIQGQSYALIEDLTTLNLALARGNGHWRAGLSAPLHLLWGSQSLDTRSFVAGDLHASVKYRPGQAPLAVTVGYGVPLQGSAYLLGTDGGVFDAALVTGFERPRLTGALNIGARIQDSVTIVNADESVAWGNQVRAQAGFGYAVRNNWEVTAELMGAYVSSSYIGLPMEAMLGGRYRDPSGKLLRMAVGIGMGTAPGVPALRLQLGVGQDVSKSTAQPETTAPAATTPNSVGAAGEQPPADGAPTNETAETTASARETSDAETSAPVETSPPSPTPASPATESTSGAEGAEADR